MLHGRERELELLRARLDGAREGTSFALVLAGEAGIGKTALLARAIELAGDEFRVLRGRGYESEAEIPYAGLLALVRPLLDLADRLSEQQGAALRSALALGPPTPHDRFAVPVAVLALLSAAADQQPLLIAVDDAHWLDPATREALFFAARRLEREGVGVLLSVREGDDAPSIDVAGLERVELGGLPAAGARRLLAGQVAPSVADALARATGGNPLALLELPTALTEDERRGLRPITTPLPTGRRVEELFSRRVAELPERTRRAIGVASALDGGALDELVAALRVLDLAEEDLAPAEAADVVAVRGSRLVFRHPLVRSAAYHGQSLAERRAAHAALAQVAGDGRQQAWHLAQAATGPDEQVAQALSDAAADARDRGGMSEAAVTFSRAAELSPEPADAASRRLDAAATAAQAGNVEQAMTLLEAAEAGPLAEGRINEARRLRGLLLLRIGHLEAGREVIEEEAARLADSDPALAAETLIHMTPMYMYSGDNEAMLRFGRRAREIVGDHDERVAELAEVVTTMALSARAQLTPEDLRLFSSPVIDPNSSGQPQEIMLGSTHGLLFLERYDEVRSRVEVHVEDARRHGAVLRLIYPLALRGELNHRTGNWRSAEADFEESLRLIDETGHDMVLASHPTAVASLLMMDLGRFEDARRHVEHAHAVATRTGARTVTLWTHWGRGRLALLRGEPGRAAEELLRVPVIRAESGWGEPNIVMADADLAEALIASGQREEAARQLERIRAEGEKLGRRFQQLVAARLDAHLAGDEEAEGHFARAIQIGETLPLPHEQARTLLLLGARRRRTGRAEDAREPLQRALAVFDRLGAVPWTALAREELRLAGARQTGEVPARPAEALSAQEYRVAQLVASGMTNREVAGSLFLSPKTIEHHLSGIYKKLGVRSRTQLARLFGDEAAPPAAA